MLLPLLLFWIGCGSSLKLHPVVLVNGECKYEGEDICYPQKGYTAFSDKYLEEVINVKINQ